jgi:Putative transposase/Transposase zinc-binding domain
MVTLGEIFRRYGPQYRAQFGVQLSDEQKQAMRAIEQCRTEALGGHVYTCPACATRRYSYHSCRNRHCPTCQHDTTQTWLERQQALLLPVPYFLVTFTLPAGLRAVAYRHQRTIYSLLFRASAAALQQLAHDPRFLDGQIGMIGVLQTWRRDLRYHPHVHYLVPAIALAEDGALRQPRNPAFLVAAKPLAILFRAKLQAALRQTDLYQHIPRETWQQPWVVDCRPVGSGASALKYLAPYIFRVALSNNRIVGVQDDRVTFRYRDGDTKQMRPCTLPALAFIGRFLQHILPHGFVKVRYYGLFRLGNRCMLEQARVVLAPPEQAGTSGATASRQVRVLAPPAVLRCPSCGQPMQLMQIIPRQSRAPPREAKDHKEAVQARRCTERTWNVVCTASG